MASKYYPAQPAEALREAFLKTDEKFIEKSKKQVNFQHFGSKMVDLFTDIQIQIFFVFL